MTTKRSKSGRDAKEAGEVHEAFATEHHGEALRLGIIAGPMIHNEPHGKIIHGEVKWVASGAADFVGVAYDGHGGTIACEAKSRKRLLYKKEITITQQQHLNAVVRGGGLALLLVRFYDDDGNIDAVIPWQSVPWKIKSSAETIEREDILAVWMISSDCKCYLERFCPVRGIPAQGIAGGQQRRFPRE